MENVGRIQHSRPPLKVAAIGVLAALVWTALVLLFTTVRATNWREENALRLSRQVATQAEGLMLSSRMKGEKDPLAWTILQLSQGVEPRVIRISRTDPEELGSRSENWSLSDDHTRLMYIKKIGSDEKSGAVLIEVDAPAPGFLGAFSKPASDLLVVVFFSVHLLIGYLAWRARQALHASEPVVEIREVEKEVIREVIREVPVEVPAALPVVAALEAPATAVGISPSALESWSQQATTGLRELGQAVKSVLRVTRDISLSSAGARESVVALNHRLHDSLRDIELDRREARALVSASIKAEALAMNVVLAALRISQGNPVSDPVEARERLRRDAEVLVSAIQTMREKAEGRERLALALRERIEPCTVDSDLALRSFDPMAGLLSELEAPSKASGEKLIEQARLLKGTPAPELLPAGDVLDQVASA